MKHSLRPVAVALALAFAAPGFTPSEARADDDTINTQITIGSLLVVVGILVWVGWQMDQEDDLRKAERLRVLPVLADDDSAVGIYLDQLSQHREDAQDLTAGLAFCADF